jgi:hypothetical protein
MLNEAFNVMITASISIGASREIDRINEFMMTTSTTASIAVVSPRARRPTRRLRLFAALGK